MFETNEEEMNKNQNQNHLGRRMFSNPLSEIQNNNQLRHSRSCTTTHHHGPTVPAPADDNNKENATANVSLPKSLSTNTDKQNNRRIVKPSSLQYCMQISDQFQLASSDSSHFSNSLKIWDYSDSEAAPASSWSTLPNKSLICRPLPIDIGRCTCVIVKEPMPHGLSNGTFFSLYTYEGQGRQNRKLAVAHHKRRTARSHFTVAQNVKGLLSNSDNTFLGTVTANLTGSKYHIWDQGYRRKSHSKQPKPPLAVVEYVPTIATCTGTHRSIKAYIPNHQSMSFKNTNQVQHIKGLPMNWEGKLDKVHQLYSRDPLYNKSTKRFELDYRDKGRAELGIQRSVKNFQLTLEENGKQTILQLGRVGKSTFVMDYRYPLTGYQAFCICLASIDAKLCCIV
ncbi:tubby F-box protein [Trifolium repens]|nr:tubby F-box protein [Trifolium repens]